MPPKFMLPVVVIVLAASAPDARSQETNYQVYADAGYIGSNRSSENGEWQGKVTTSSLNEANLHLAMTNFWKETSPDSRWGFELGLQTGDDTTGVVPAQEDSPVSNADALRHLYRANVSYVLGDNGNIELTGGLINSFIGYESFLAVENLNYTRAYLTDAVPFFFLGAGLMWDAGEALDLGFYVVSGYDYLSDVNSAPSYGMSAGFQIAEGTEFTQNFYYGPDQENTDIDYWRFHSNSIIERRRGRWLLAASFDFGNERQFDLPGEPRQSWYTSAIWVGWAATDHLELAVRPEYHQDENGVLRGIKQKIRGITATAKYEWMLAGKHRIVTMFEARYDHSSGVEGGFPDSGDERPDDQTLLIASFLWSFGT